MPVGIICNEEIDDAEEKSFAGTVLEKSQMGEILTTSRRVGLKDGHKRFFHCKGSEGKVCEIRLVDLMRR